MAKLKVSEIAEIIFPPFEKINVYKSYGNKYIRLSVHHISQPFQFHGLVCGQEFWADYTPEGLQTITAEMNKCRIEALKSLRVVEEEE